MLHVLTDPRLARGRSPLEQLRAAAAGGADIVQLRDKHATPAEILAIARELVPVARDLGVALVINDHWRIAREAGAAGVHLGPDDADPAEVRAACPPPFLVGASVRNADRARVLEAAGVDLLGVGPVFGTTSKADAPGAVGPERIAAVAAAVRIPIVGIGGVDATNAASVLRAGASGVAVLSGVASADDPEAAVRALRRALDRVAGSPDGC
jgi:thiamine-phosphate diphosphorylase